MMNNRRQIQRKSTFNSTASREADHHREAKTPPNRITSMKSLSFDEIPFSQHIFQQSGGQRLKNNILEALDSKELVFVQKTEKEQKNLFLGKVANKEVKNPFFQACLENRSRNIPKRADKTAKDSLQTSEDLEENNITTFRVIKKKSLNAYQDENIGAII